METKNIKQTVSFKAEPHEVYEALMDSKKHSKFSGGKAIISRKVGGKISAYDDYIEGVNVELVPDEKIVQTWRGSDWPEGQFSKVTFKIEKTPAGSKLTFLQSGVPIEFYEDVKQGWIDWYWTPMKEMLEK
jgi:activator of HSP90 ATPase